MQGRTGLSRTDMTVGRAIVSDKSKAKICVAEYACEDELR